MHVWSAVVASVAVPAWFFVPESPRWLACNKRVIEAEDIIMVREAGEGMKSWNTIRHICRSGVQGDGGSGFVDLIWGCFTSLPRH